MRFSSVIFSMSHDPENDGAVIDSTLKEAELAEEIGMDAVWLTEHHFDGETAYVDPLVFGAAVAAKTRRIKIGFAVVQMAFHHPVRLAAQTALLDNLSHGRLIVGIGRGTALNHFEYAGFGMTMQDGIDRMDEAEDLLVKAWTTRDLRYAGKHWKVSFPLLRPRPYQRPHPPLVRACLSEESVVAMARIGRPIMLVPVANDVISSRLRKYKEALFEAGFGEDRMAQILDQVWVSKSVFVDHTDDAAREIASQGLRRDLDHIQDARRRYNPNGLGTVNTSQADTHGDDFEQTFIVGTPQRVSNQIAELRDLGVRNLMMNFNVGEMLAEDVERSMRLFGEEVLPLFK
mgnify:CR=1 FL=1